MFLVSVGKDSTLKVCFHPGVGSPFQFSGTTLGQIQNTKVYKVETELPGPHTDEVYYVKFTASKVANWGRDWMLKMCTLVNTPVVLWGWS